MYFRYFFQFFFFSGVHRLFLQKINLRSVSILFSFSRNSVIFFFPDTVLPTFFLFSRNNVIFCFVFLQIQHKQNKHCIRLFFQKECYVLSFPETVLRFGSFFFRDNVSFFQKQCYFFFQKQFYVLFFFSKENISFFFSETVLGFHRFVPMIVLIFFHKQF